MKKKLPILLMSLLLLATAAKAQEAVDGKKSSNHTPYELLSSYYNSGEFQPFQKKTWYVGLAFSLEDQQSVNNQKITEKILDGENLDYNILVKGGYYTQDYNMIGLSFNYYQSSFDGVVFKDPDTINSNSLTRGYEIIPNLRTSIPLNANQRLSFFVELDLIMGYENTLTRNTKNIDEISKTYSTNYTLGAAIAPGITFFAMENFAFEVQLNVLQYTFNVVDTSTDDQEESRVTRNNIGLDIDLLSLNLGLAYYFNKKKPK